MKEQEHFKRITHLKDRQKLCITAAFFPRHFKAIECG